MTSHSQSKGIRPIGGMRKPNSFQLPPTTSQINQKNLIENVDKRLDWTYTGIAKQQIKSVTTSQTMFPNNLLYDYIKYIYDKYNIQDPLVKYGNGRISNINYQDQTLNQASHRSHSSIHNSNSNQNNSQHLMQNNLSFAPIMNNLHNNSNVYTFKRKQTTQQPHQIPQVNNQIINSSRHAYDRRGSLPLTNTNYQTNQNIEQSQSNINRTNQQTNSIHYSPNPFLHQQHQTQSIERSIIQPSQVPSQRNIHQRNDTELQSTNRPNRMSDLGQVSKSYMYEGSNIPYRPSILDAQHGTKRYSETPQKNYVPLQYSSNSRYQIQQDQGRKRLIENTQTGISRDQRNQEEKTQQNFSISESNNRNRQQYPYNLSSDKKAVSKSTTFNRQNPQYERNHRQYQPFHRPTGSNFENLQSINNNNDLRNQTNTAGFQTPLRQQRKFRDEATTESRRIERPIAGQINTTNIKGSRGQLNQHRQSRHGIDAYSNTTNISEQQIPSVYRYCFMCQHPILEHNISIHEQKCASFKHLYDETFDQILRRLVQKIKRMQHKIWSILNDEQQDRLKNLKSSVSTWMGSIQNVSQNGENSLQMQRNYKQIERCFRSKQMQLLQLSHKLKWFLSIRQNIKQQFNV